MKTRSTKGALLMSALSLFLCFTMLMGTTFAWFTDSAASNGNIITAGTLDVEMYWADGTEAVPTTDSGWIDASTGAIFQYTLWEPGYAEVRHIKIANEGNLALKYKVLIQANGTVSDLSDVIDVYYADPAVQVADASALTADNKLGTLTDVLANLGLTGNGTLEAGKSDVITLALKMQEGAGNEYMGKSIGTDFSIILVATQLTSEEDSFDDQYDADATYPALSMPVTLPAAGGTVVAATLTTDKENPSNGVSVTLPAATMEKIVDIAATDNVTAVAIAHSEPKVDTTAKSVSFDSIDIVDQTGKVIDLATIGNTAPITVTVPVGDAFAEGTVVVIYHDAEPVASAVVTNKTVTYTTTHFCRVDVNLGDGNVDSAAELAAAIANGGTIELNADMTLDSTLVVPAGVTVLLDMNGHKLTATDKNVIRNDGGNLTIVDGTFERTGTVIGYAVNQASGTMALDGVTVICGLYTSGTSLIVNDSDISHHQSSRHAIYAYNTAVTLNSGNFYNYNAGNATIMAAGNAAVVINGGTYGIADGRATLGWTSCLLDMNGTATMTLNDGTFNGGFRVNSANAKVTINGGSFNDCYGSSYNIYSGKVEVMGGTYTDAAAKTFAEKYVADGYKLFDNGNGTYTVEANVSKVATEAELREAVNGTRETILLTADIALTETLVINRSLTLDLGDKTLMGPVKTLVRIEGGNVVIVNGALSNEHAAATDTKFSLYLTGDAVASITDVEITTSGTGIYLDGNARITELNAKVDSYFNANGTCAYDAVSVNGNARVDLISGGEYVSRVATEYIEWWNTTHSYSGTPSYALRVNSANASVGEIRGGTFLSGDDRSNSGAIIQVNSGKVELISGGYFGFVKFGLQSPYKVLFVNSANGGYINKITGGTYEVCTNKYGCDFAGIVDASGCQIVDTGVDVEVKAQFSSSVKTYVVDVLEVVAK